MAAGQSQKSRINFGESVIEVIFLSRPSTGPALRAFFP